MAFGQLQTRTLVKHAVLVVDGQVVDVFQSASFKEQFLVKILVQKSEAIRLEKMNASIRFPAPGENIYVHVNSSNTYSKRNNRISPDLPRPNMTIRAVLHSGEHQEWVGQARDWYQEFGQDSAISKPSSQQLGITTEIAFYGGKAVLKVINVAGGSPGPTRRNRARYINSDSGRQAIGKARKPCESRKRSERDPSIEIIRTEESR